MNALKARKNRDKLLIFCAFLIFSASTIIWTVRDKTPPPWDPADHLRFAYDYYRPLSHLRIGEFLKEFFVTTHYYTPLVHLLTGLFFLIFGASRVSGICVNLLSLGIIMYSVYWMGSRIFPVEEDSDPSTSNSETESGPPAGSSWLRSGLPFSAAAVAAVLAASYHFPAWLMHDAFLDFPLIAATAAAMALLIRAGDFENVRHSIAFGVAAGLGLLTKETFPFFFLLPGFYTVGRLIFKKKGRGLLNLLLACVVAAVIAAIWYLPHLRDVINIYRINAEHAVTEGEAPLFSFISNMTYLHGLVSYQIQGLFGGLFIVGLVYSLVKRPVKSLLLVLWVVSGIVGFTMLANKDMRYTLPILPAVALLSVSWLNDLALRLPKHLQNTRSQLANLARVLTGIRVTAVAFAGLIIAWSFVSFFNAQWPAPGMGNYVDTPRFRWMVFARNYDQFDHRPLHEDWSVPEIVEKVGSLSASPTGLTTIATQGQTPDLHPDLVSRSHRPSLGVFIDLPFLNPSSIALYSRLLSSGRGAPPVVDIEWLVEPGNKDRVDKCDYYLLRTGLDKAEWVAPLERYGEQMVKDSPEKYQKVAAFPTPNPDQEAILYRVVK